ncbi:aa3-type cytochrome oxidase subunit II [Sinomonas terrae]|uniref:cytochrome-c oxidase n=1 Tax=Sinomonas terrae TaxID=2908838 RepID=A0ABS9U0V6_9MICC|nr:cytochrome c oxidase subunit II [Sinomonas terrae]MCH6470332.1 cytochrome c oxidase subunit II [Sinomonas terrae]
MRSQNRTSSQRTRNITVASVAVAGALALSGCTSQVQNGWLPGSRDTTSNTGMVTDLWVNSWIAALTVGAITWGLILWCIIAYRRRKGTVGFPRQTSYNLPLEIFYTAIPLFLVVVFFYFTDRDQRAIDNPNANPDVTVNVVGKQWSWDFNYKQGGIVKDNVYEAGTQTHLNGTPVDLNTLPTLYLPVGKTVTLDLTSRDVIHSFWVPAFLQKRDVVPGHPNTMYFTPEKVGTYEGKCAELCGEYHSEMLFQVKVVSEADFQAHLSGLPKGLLDTTYDRNPDLNQK